MRRLRRRSRTDRGAVAIIVAASIVVFMGILAFAIDLGMTRSDRARAQGVADNAALSAVYTYCESLKTKTAVAAQADATAAANAVASANGYTATVTPQGASSAEGWRVDVTSTTKGRFMGVLVSGSQISSQLAAVANASCSTAVTLPALYADSTNCGDKSFEWSGSNSTVTGGIHSNDEIKFGGNNNVFGQGTYVDQVKDSNKINWNPSASNPSKTSVRTMPATFNMADFRPTTDGGTRSTSEPNYKWYSGNFTHSSGTLAPGTYVANGNIILSGGTISGSYTFVAGGHVTISASGVNITAREQGLAAWGNRTSGCDNNEAFSLNGSNNTINGIMYAPNGWAKVEGSNHTMNAAFLAKTLYVAGSNFSLTNYSTLGGGTSGITLVR
ncbi:Tad domain-containing protein [Nocardioides coralli]|uniref:Tad domain-containing protein n=1 Tax=Nocardioides coralli TaxID=2872154 RepID=UPI001CA3C077|nr:Tad domain-containing protein [Nocardioides coralli]QZY28123.1 Tad domain-containing protein [Nocardioides coralli]